MKPEEVEGLAIEVGLCRVDGFGETVRTEYATVDHVLAFAAAIEAATIERVAQWYASKGWLMDEGDVADAIRALAKEKS
jgi:hypothetical protein